MIVSLRCVNGGQPRKVVRQRGPIYSKVKFAQRTRFYLSMD